MAATGTLRHPPIATRPAPAVRGRPRTLGGALLAIAALAAAPASEAGHAPTGSHDAHAPAAGAHPPSGGAHDARGPTTGSRDAHAADARGAAPAAGSAPAPARDGVAPLPTLPPVPRPMQLGSADPARPRGDAAGPRLDDDLAAMRAALERLRSSQEGRAAAIAGSAAAGDARPPAPAGAARASARLPGLAIDGDRISARLRGVPLDQIIGELAALTGAVIDDAEATGRTRPADLLVTGLSLDQVLDRLCGAAGLAWSAEDAAHGRRIRVVDARAAAADAANDRRRAEDAFERAASWGEQSARRDSATAAEAAWRRARAEQDARRNVAAIERYGALVDQFGGSSDPHVRQWVQAAVRGIGDCMAALGNHLDARSVYRNYIVRAAEDDRQLPGVFLAAAAAGRRQAAAAADPVAMDEAIDDLHQLLERFADAPWAAAEVAAGRLELATMLHAERRWAEADAQLGRYLAAAGIDARTAAHRLQLMAADNAFGLGRLEDAHALYLGLHRAWADAKGEAGVAAADYARAAFQVGMCRLGADPPRHVEALFAFLRARQDFPQSDLDAELLVGIARCYAELERRDETMATLWELLRGDALRDGRPGSLQLDELIGGLVGRLGDYPGPVRARVLFYLAQAAWHQAQRDPAERAAQASAAVGYYQRVLDEKPPVELRHAAMLGRARAALVAGQEDAAIIALQDLLRDPQAASRDRELAARMLGEHYRAKGRLQDAIRAFRGEVGE